MTNTEHTTTDAPSVSSYNWMFAVLLVLAMGVFGVGVYLAATKQGHAMLGAGSLSVIGVLSAWAIALACNSAAADRTLAARLAPVVNRLDQAVATLTLVSEQQLISDRAKQVAFREKDRDAYIRAAREDIAKNDFDAAATIIDDMEREFGARDEVLQLRSEIGSRRDDSIRRQLDSAIGAVDRHVQAEQWQLAVKEADRLKTLFPDQVRVQMLSDDIEQKRQSVKQNLLNRWQDSVRAKHIDDAIHVLRKLDLYLTPVEAAALEEDARMVFKEKLAMLRVDFTAAVQSHNWREARKLAEVVINDFPNTQMAREVRDMMPTLEERLRALQQEQGLPAMAS